MILSLTQALPLEDYDLSLLTEAEFEHIESAKVPLLQSCRAHSCFELRKMAGVSSKEAAVLRSAKGAPYFANLDYNISISHKNNYCWLGLVQKPGIIGVDIEKIVEVSAAEKMFKHVADDFEKEQFHNLSEHYSKEVYLTILWSLKESLFKCENLNHNKVSFLIDPFQATASLHFGAGSTLESLWAGREIQIKFTIQKSYVCSSIYVV